METKTQVSEIQNSNPNQGFYAQPRAYLSKDGEYLVLVLPGNQIVRKHVNWFKSIMGLPFERKAKTA